MWIILGDDLHTKLVRPSYPDKSLSVPLLPSCPQSHTVRSLSPLSPLSPSRRDQVSPAFILQTCQGSPAIHPEDNTGSLSPVWQSHNGAPDPAECPARGDRTIKHLCGSAEGGLAGCLLWTVPSSEAPRLAQVAQGSSGSSGSAPVHCREAVAAQSCRITEVAPLVACPADVG